MSLELVWRSPGAEQTRRFGMALGQALCSGDVICLSGPLGAGKTALAAGIGAAWGALEAFHSPTFVLVHEHRRAADRQRLFHLDCYRLERPEDAEMIGIQDMLEGSDVLVVEWPEHIAPFLPADSLWIAIEYGESDEPTETRQLHLRAEGGRFADRWPALVAWTQQGRTAS